MKIKVLENLKSSLRELATKKAVMGWEDPEIINLIHLLFFGGAKNKGLAKKFGIKGELPSRNLKEVFTTNKVYIETEREVGVDEVYDKISKVIEANYKGRFNELIILRLLGSFYVGKFRALLDGRSKLNYGIPSNAPWTIKEKGFDNPLYKTGKISRGFNYKLK